MNINKKINSIILEILLIIVIVVSTNIYWDNLIINKSFSTKYINNRMLSLSINEHISELYPAVTFNDNNYIELKVQNSSNLNKEYVMYLIIENSTLDLNNLKINYNNKDYYLNDLEKINLYGKTYFTLEENVIKRDSVINKKCYFWLAEETSNNEQNKSFQISFDIDEI